MTFITEIPAKLLERLTLTTAERRALGNLLVENTNLNLWFIHLVNHGGDWVSDPAQIRRKHYEIEAAYEAFSEEPSEANRHALFRRITVYSESIKGDAERRAYLKANPHA